MATVASISPLSLPVAGNDMNAEPITNQFNNILTFLNEASNLDEDNVDHSSANGIATLQNVQTLTGAKTFTGGVTITDLDNAAGSVQTNLTIEWNPADGENMTDNSSGVGIDFKMPDDADNQIVYASIDVMCVADNNGTERGGFSFRAQSGGGSESEIMTVETGLTTAGTVLTLATAETTVVDGDVLGRINFQAPAEASGTDAILVAASIYAEADDTFAADNNDADLVFAVAESEAASDPSAERMRLSYDGTNVGLSFPGATNIATSAGALTVNGTGGINIQEGGSDIVTISDARALATANTASINLDATGAIAIESSGGAIAIGDDNVDQTINLATKGTRTLNVGINDGTDVTTLAVKGNTTSTGTITVGVDDTGYDVKFFGATSGKYLLWDEDEDTLQLVDNTNLTFGTGADADIFYDGTDLNISPAVVGAGDIVVNGASMEFADSEGVTFGTGKDATIQFDATNLVYNTAGYHSFTGGDVHVGNGQGLIVGHTAQETISTGDGSTDLVPEVQILGTTQADASLMLAAFSTTATRAAAPTVALVKSGDAAIDGTHVVVTDNEILGSIIAYGDDGTDLESPAAAIEFAVDGTPGTGDMPGRMSFYTASDGGETLSERIRIDASGHVAIQGNATTGATSVADKWDKTSPVYGTVLTIGSGMSVINYEADYSWEIIGNAYFDGSNFRAAYNDEATKLITDEGAFEFHTAPAVSADAVLSFSRVFGISASGNVTKPTNCAFLCESAAVTNITGDGTDYTMIYATEIYDKGGDFSTSTFTAPVTGVYLLGALLNISGIASGQTDGRLTIVTSNRNYNVLIDDVTQDDVGGYMRQTFTVLADMDASDTATLMLDITGGAKSVDVDGGNQFYGTLMQ